MERYSIIEKKFPREILLLKSTPCKWGKCSFCDYIEDNSKDIDSINQINKEAIDKVIGKYGRLEVINSGNVFELPEETLARIKVVIDKYDIKQLFLEAHWIYRKKLQSMRDYFGVEIFFKTGLESFNRDFREEVLNKGFTYDSIDELKSYFNSVCLMVGIKGQTKEMIEEDIRLAMENFNHFTVNVYTPNSTSIIPDTALIKWFQKEYAWLEDEPKCEVLWVNTDFGVG